MVSFYDEFRYFHITNGTVNLYFERKNNSMLIRKFLLQTTIVVVILFQSCASSRPAKTNVLSRTSTPQQKPAVQTQNTQQSQTVFVRPDQKNNNNADKKPIREEPENEPAAPVITPGNPTAQYYRFLADSMQRYAKSTYYKMADSLMKEMTKTPANTKNPAVNAAQWYTTVNFNIRKPNYVILHHTAQNSADQTLFTFSISRTQVSAHYVIGRDGVVYQLLNDYMRAWHAGNSKWGSITDMNSCSIGIEIDNNGSESFSDAQINALLKLLDYLKEEYNIPQGNFIAHSDIAPTRKNDPSKFFPWNKLADAGFGYWYDVNNMTEPPADFNALLALRVIGYDISNQAAAIKAFKLHYIQSDISPRLTDYDKKVLYNLYKNY